MAGNIWDQYVESNARRFGVPPALVQSVISAESGGRQNAVSPKGAGGYMQIMPNTYAELRQQHGLGEDRFDPANNIAGGTAYLAQLYKQFGNWPDAVAAYNAGPGRWAKVKAGQSSAPAETAAYVPKVMGAVPELNVAKLPTPQAAQENGGMADFSFGSARAPRRSLTGLLEVDEEKNFYEGLGGLWNMGQTPSQPPAPRGEVENLPSQTERLDVTGRMNELMQGLLAPQARGPSMTPGQYQLAGAGEAVGQLAGITNRRVGIGEILGALGGGLTRGTAAADKAQQAERATQFQELGNIGKIQQYQRGEATNAAKIQAARQYASQLRGTGDPQKIALAAAIENDPSLMDNIIGKQADAAFPKDQFYTLAPGAQRRGPNNEIIADNPRAAVTPQRNVQHVELNDGIYVVNPDGTRGNKIGDRPKPQAQPQSWSEKEEILKSDKSVESGTTSIASLTRALELNDQAYEGTGAGVKTWLDRNLYPGDLGGEATTEFSNIMGKQALSSLKDTFGAAPTEGERKILMDLEASVNMSARERKVIIENAIALAKARIEREKARGQAMRGGTYFSQGLPQPGADQSGGGGGGLPAGNYVYNPETGELEQQQ